MTDRTSFQSEERKGFGGGTGNCPYIDFFDEHFIVTHFEKNFVYTKVIELQSFIRMLKLNKAKIKYIWE